MKPRCGIEVSSDAVKYVVLRGRRLLGYGRVPLGEGEEIGPALARLRDEGKLPTNHVSVALGTQTSVLRMFSFPPMPAADLARVVDGEAAKELRIFTEEMAWGYLPLPRKPVGKRRSDRGATAERCPGLIALTAKAGLEAFERGIASFGFAVDLLTTTSLGLLGHVCGQRDLAESGEAVAVLHIGSDRMVLAVMQGGQFRQLRDLAVGLDASLLVSREATGTDDAQVDWEALDQIGRGLDEVTQVARQIRRTLEADAPAHGGQPIHRLLLTGDVTRGEAMAPLLQNEVGLPVAVLDPLPELKLVGVEPFFAREAASYALPLTLARAGGPGPILHLGPPPAQKPPLALWGAATALAVASLIVAVASAPLLRRAQTHESAPAPSAAVSSEQEEGSWIRASGVAPRAPLEWLGRVLPVQAEASLVDVRRQGPDWSVRFEGTLQHPNARGRLSAWTALADSLGHEPRVSGQNLLPLAGEQPSPRDGSPVAATFRFRGGP